MASKMIKLNDDQLEQVVGGDTCHVRVAAGANVRSGPGSRYTIRYHMDVKEECETSGTRVRNSADGYDWVQLTDGGWVPDYVLGI